MALLGPIILFQVSDANAYALFEVSASLAAIFALIAGGGLSAALPYDYLIKGSADVLYSMKIVLRTISRISLALITLFATIAYFSAQRWGAEADLWCLRAALLVLLVFGWLAQNFTAAVLRIHGKLMQAAACEHGIWLALVITCSLNSILGARTSSMSLLVCSALNAVAMASLSQYIIRASLKELHPAGQAPKAALKGFRSGTPFVAGQICSIAGASFSRIILLSTGHPLASAYSAIGMRLSAPVQFIYQSLYGALVQRLFNEKNPNSSVNGVHRRYLISTLIYFTSILQIAMGAILFRYHIIKVPNSTSFIGALFFCTQTIMFFGIAETSSYRSVGSAEHRQYAKRMWLTTVLVAITLAVAAHIATNEQSALLFGTGIPWIGYGFLAFLTLIAGAKKEGKTISRRSKRQIILMYALPSIIGASSLYCFGP